jgi:hypothetical protein
MVIAALPGSMSYQRGGGGRGRMLKYHAER